MVSLVTDPLQVKTRGKNTPRIFIEKTYVQKNYRGYIELVTYSIEMGRFFRRRISIILKAIETGSLTLKTRSLLRVYQVMYGVTANLKSGIIQGRKGSNKPPTKRDLSLL